MAVSQTAAKEISRDAAVAAVLWKQDGFFFGSSTRGFCDGNHVSTWLDLSGVYLNTATGQYRFVKKKTPSAATHRSSCAVYLCRAGNGWWWVPLIAPLIGGPLGAGVYRAMVEMHHPPESEGREGPTKEESVPLGKQENTCDNTCATDSHWPPPRRVFPTPSASPQQGHVATSRLYEGSEDWLTVGNISNYFESILGEMSAAGQGAQ